MTSDHHSCGTHTPAVETDYLNKNACLSSRCCVRSTRVRLSRARRLTRCEYHFREALHLRPDFAEAYVNVGVVSHGSQLQSLWIVPTAAVS